MTLPNSHWTVQMNILVQFVSDPAENGVVAKPSSKLCQIMLLVTSLTNRSAVRSLSEKRLRCRYQDCQLDIGASRKWVSIVYRQCRSISPLCRRYLWLRQICVYQSENLLRGQIKASYEWMLVMPLFHVCHCFSYCIQTLDKQRWFGSTFGFE